MERKSNDNANSFNEELITKVSNNKNIIIYVSTLIIAVAIIIIGKYLFDSKENMSDLKDFYPYTYAKVSEIVDVSDDSSSVLGEDTYFKTIIFKAKDKNNKTIIGMQKIDSTYPILSAEVSEGDDVILAYTEKEESFGYYEFIDFDRKASVLILILFFFLAVIIFGKMKGVNTSIALILSFAYIFEIFIPSITLGYNIYLTTALLCIYIIVTTLILVAGISVKTCSAMLGCFGGLLVASFITFLYAHFSKITGGGDEHSIAILLLNEENIINIKAMLFSSILIGALGAVMDVGMSISSSLAEINQKVSNISFKELFRSGIDIGRDIVGTMANTLFLAYVGSSLCTLVILMSYNTYTTLLEKEIIIIEILQAVAGTIGIIITIPITSLVSAFIFRKTQKDG